MASAPLAARAQRAYSRQVTASPWRSAPAPNLMHAASRRGAPVVEVGVSATDGHTKPSAVHADRHDHEALEVERCDAFDDGASPPGDHWCPLESVGHPPDGRQWPGGLVSLTLDKRFDYSQSARERLSRRRDIAISRRPADVHDTAAMRPVLCISRAVGRAVQLETAKAADPAGGAAARSQSLTKC